MTLQGQFAFKLPFRARHRTPGLAGCSFSSFLPGAGVGRGGICFPSSWILFFKSKRATACWRMGAASTPDSRMAGQAVRVPELPGRLRPPTAPLRPRVWVQTQAGHFLGAEQPQARGFPTWDLGFSILEWRGFHLLAGGEGCRGHGTEGRGGCFLQFPAEALWA